MLQLDVSSPCMLPELELAERLERTGYLMLPPLEQLDERIEALWQAGETFFRLGAETKSRNRLDNQDGWHSAGPPDAAECFWAQLAHAGETWRFPDAAARSLHGAALELAASLEAVLRPVTHVLAQHYAGPAFQPEQAFVCDRASRLRLERHPPHADRRELLADRRAAGHYFALLVLDGPGLEMLTPGGGWQPLAVRPGEILAVPGETLLRLGVRGLPSLRPRLRHASPARHRHVMTCFADPNPEACFRPWRPPAPDARD